jgi:tetratricopeptide (TPR) repeat protein
MKLNSLLTFSFIFSSALISAQDLPTIIKNADAKLNSSDFAGAETGFATAIRLNEAVVADYLDKMKKYGTLNEFQRSSSDMPDGFIYNHDLAVPFYGHGRSLQGLGRTDEALSELEKAISIDPKYADAICERGIIEISKGMKDKGCIDLRKAKVLGNEKAKSMYESNACSSMSGSFVTAGDKKLEAKDYAGALQEYTSAIQLNADSASPFMKRGVCNVILKKYDKAISDYNKALKLSGDTVNVLYLRGLAYNASGNYKSAFDDFSKVIRLAPNHYDAYMQRGAACEGMENFRSANYDYSEAIRIKPADGLAYYKRGLINQDAKDNSACKDFKTAASLGHEDAKSMADGCGNPAPKK